LPLVGSWLLQHATSYINVSETDISEFVAGNKNAFACNDKHLLPICNIVVKVLNIVMSYTCLTVTSCVNCSYRTVLFAMRVIQRSHQ
jgi:hypothetical protein